MKTLQQQIEDMRTQVKESVDTERKLVEAIGDEFRRCDEELLNAIRSVAAGHEMRRGVIVAELQALAEKAGSLLKPVPGRDASISNRSTGAIPHDQRSPHYETRIPWSEREVVSYLEGRRISGE